MPGWCRVRNCAFDNGVALARMELYFDYVYICLEYIQSGLEFVEGVWHTQNFFNISNKHASLMEALVKQ